MRQRLAPLRRRMPRNDQGIDDVAAFPSLVEQCLILLEDFTEISDADALLAGDLYSKTANMSDDPSTRRTKEIL